MAKAHHENKGHGRGERHEKFGKVHGANGVDGTTAVCDQGGAHDGPPAASAYGVQETAGTCEQSEPLDGLFFLLLCRYFGDDPKA